jgi:GntR family transcriptional repressor for pyruvate dehydrogenase complex
MADRDVLTFDAIGQTPNLRSGLVDTLVAQIEAGELAPGQRLPTEQEIVTATGVSRTVVREALASLRARGLITTRQGLGAFVAKEPPPKKTFSIVPHDLETIDEVLGVLELRMGVEVEAAGLAARRRTADDLARMRARLDAIDTAVSVDGAGSREDFSFHRAIAAATGNANFTGLFDTFGAAMLPRQWASFDRMDATAREKHFARMRDEHGAILAAIEAQDPAAAQRAMRRHLTRSYKRFEQLRDGVSS